MDHRARLRDLLVERSLALGDFTLSSGARSSYYVDARRTTMSAEGQSLVGILGYQRLRELVPTVRWVGGLTLGADPISNAIAHQSWQEGDPIDAFTVRKAAKDHGTGRRIEGGLPPGAPVLVVEDTLTSGASALEAVSALRFHGADVKGVLALVDREAGGVDALQEAGLRVSVIFTAAELLATHNRR
jgi:orotate phosphoribosyltransferase